MKPGHRLSTQRLEGAKNSRFFFAPVASSRFTILFVACFLAALACARSDIPIDFSAITPLPGSTPLNFQPERTPVPGSGGGSAPTAAFDEPPTSAAPGFTRTPRPTRDVSASPTPDPTRVTALDRKNVETYIVKRGDTLNAIGERYGVTAAQIAQANNLQLADPIFPGQALLIPLPDKTAYGPALKLLPDSEFVYGPSTADFNLEGFIHSRGGYLAAYSEEVDAVYLDGLRPRTLTGAEIMRLVATRYSVHPRLLLAVLEQQSGWVTNPRPDSNTLAYPLRRVEVRREGLFRQLSWAANQLNLGYYGWRAGWLVSLTFETGGLKIIAPELNAGTVGVQNFFARVSTREQWLRLVGEGGFRATYDSLFGNPFRFAEEPLVPPDLVQPPLTLPFEPGKVWAFTGGPHGAWDSGSAWAALDFAPPAQAEGCVSSDEWVTASAPGVVVRSEFGAVAVDLDGDGFEGTGWTLFYMHIEQRDRVAVGTWVNTGDRLGHPSCEGGFSNGTHVHIARKYNGEWLNADGAIPFVLDGWVAQESLREYDGWLVKDGQRMEACDCRSKANAIARP